MDATPTNISVSSDSIIKLLITLVIFILFLLGIVFGGTIMYFVMNEKYNVQEQILESNKNSLKDLELKFKESEEICQNEYRRFWLEQKQKLLNEFKFEK